MKNKFSLTSALILGIELIVIVGGIYCVTMTIFN